MACVIEYFLSIYEIMETRYFMKKFYLAHSFGGWRVSHCHLLAQLSSLVGWDHISSDTCDGGGRHMWERDSGSVPGFLIAT